ncbi:kinase-like domain-containing protein [Rhizophagus clarus]|uniref:Kinase-like domain-containing protein n=1 Tax=Rhizophagus clarus TaxID=94130 RepID=A0A8H3L9X8_9GLOM|nr:kinase-like domain-containing protein [Rhizophagus clarus]
MSIRQESVVTAIDKANDILNFNIHNTINQCESAKKIIMDNKSLTKVEKKKAIKIIKQHYDHYKVIYNEGTRRVCENCKEECLATLYCEICIRNNLKSKFSEWTSENDNIDNLIQNCQMESLSPDKIIEWIPYNKLKNIKYLTKGGCSEIYTANWIGGSYNEWDSKKQKLRRFGTHKVILKTLKNIESANRIIGAKSHLAISNKWSNIVKCYGLTQDIKDKKYMLVMYAMSTDLRSYLQQNHDKITWEERIAIIYDIIIALYRVHKENTLHRDLHSGNILYLKSENIWCISDLGFCSPADIPLKSIYGNLSYVAPEVITEKKQSFASDIYSIGIIMWEISSAQPPFIEYEHNYDFAMKIVNGMRPQILSDTPLEYKNLMEQCWDTDPSKRPDIGILLKEIQEMKNFSFEKITNDENNDKNIIIKKFFKNFNICQSFKSKKKTAFKVNKYESRVYLSEYLPYSVEDDDALYHISNLHPEEQDELEIPDEIF